MAGAVATAANKPTQTIATERAIRHRPTADKRFQPSNPDTADVMRRTSTKKEKVGRVVRRKSRSSALARESLAMPCPWDDPNGCLTPGDLVATAGGKLTSGSLRRLFVRIRSNHAARLNRLPNTLRGDTWLRPTNRLDRRCLPHLSSRTRAIGLERPTMRPANENSFRGDDRSTGNWCFQLSCRNGA